MLEKYRNDIDKIDNDISRLLAERIDVCLKIAEYKKANNIPIFNSNREQDVLDKVCKEKTETQKRYIIPIYKEMMKVSKIIQNEEIKK